MKHELKIWPEYYAAVKSGEKTFEVRKNDRDFKKGDTVRLVEYDLNGDRYTDSPALEFCIGYVFPMPGTYDNDIVVFSLLPLVKP